MGDVRCVHCDRELARIQGRLVHLGADGWISVGCRAASFSSDQGWDDSIPRRQQAKPPAGVTVVEDSQVLVNLLRANGRL